MKTKLHNRSLSRLAGYIAQQYRFRGRYTLGRMLSAGTPIINIEGALVQLQLGDYVSDQLYALGAYEPQTIRLAKSLCETGSLFLDVGAHIGLYSLVLAAQGCKVVGLEPNHATFERYSHNIKINQLDGLVTPLCCAVGTEARVLQLFSDCDMNSGGTSLVGVGRGVNYTVTVGIDTILKSLDISNVCLMKLDVEGAEVAALSSLADIRPKHIILEWLGGQKDGLASEFYASNLGEQTRALGYSAFDVRGRPASQIETFAECNVHLVHQNAR
jgi:FkbM family methyltransferase